MKRSLLLATFRARVIPGRFLARRTFRQGLAVATAGLAFVGSTSATDLIVNGSFEADGDIKNSGGLAGGPATGWTGFLQTYTFQDLYFNGPVIPAEENPGTHYTWQHRAVQGVDGPAAVPQVTQTVQLNAAVSEADLDAGQAQYTFSAWLASYGMPRQNPEQPYLTVQFYDANNAALGSAAALDRATTNNWVRNADPSDRTPPSASNHQWAQYVRTSLIPAHARTAIVGLGRSPNSDLSGSPDTYVDLVKLDVVKCTNAITRDLVAHLKLDGDYSDSSGHGVVGQPVNSPTFEAGQLGQAVRLTTKKDLSINNYVSLGYPSVLKFGSAATGDATDFSFSFWAKIDSISDDQPFLSNKNWDSGGNLGWVVDPEPDGLKWNYRDDMNDRRDTGHVAPQLEDGHWHHVAVTFQRSGAGTIFVDGALTTSASIAPTPPATIGSADTDSLGFNVNLGQDGRGTYTDNGNSEIDMVMDDLGIWRRLLTAGEVREIYTKGLLGFHLEDCAPETTFILNQPSNVTTYITFDATFRVVASGAEPLRYQWQVGGADIPNATNASLTLRNIQPSDAGAYHVIVTGGGGQATSSDATLTVLPAPACEVASGLVAHLKFDGDYSDSGGAGVFGTPVGSPVFEAGKLGLGVRVNNTKDGLVNNYVSLGYPSVLKFGSADTSDATDFSFSFWAKIYHQADDQAFIANKNWDSGGNPGWVIATENDGMKWNLKDSLNGRRDGAHVGGQLLDGSFHHVVTTFERNGAGKTYVDGVLLDTVSMAPDPGVQVGSLDTDISGLNINIGQDGRGTYTDGGNAEVDMVMDDLGIWRRALTAQEVACIFIAGQQGRPLPTLGPRLSFAPLPFGDLNISWPINITGYVLESSKSLGADGAWTPVDPAFILNNTLTISPCCDSDYPKSRFFRLRPMAQ